MDGSEGGGLVEDEEGVGFEVGHPRPPVLAVSGGVLSEFLERAHR
jgi:hypothetical protein